MLELICSICGAQVADLARHAAWHRVFAVLMHRTCAPGATDEEWAELVDRIAGGGS